MKTLLLAFLTLGLAIRGIAQPVITQQPQSRTNAIETTAAFSVTAKGTIPLNYQWRYQTGSLDGATNRSLSLTNVQPSQQGDYAVEVSDSTGKVLSQTAALTVASFPLITAQPESAMAWVGGGSVQLAVTAVGKTPMTYQWYRDGMQVTGATLRGTNRTLNITKATLTNRGSYIVVVTNIYGATTSLVAAVRVLEMPTPTGTAIPGLSKLDDAMKSLLLQYAIPGGALAVAKDGRLVFARGYGYGDINTLERVQPDSLFRVGSLSKLITSAATMKLVEEGRLKLTNSAFGVLQYPTPRYPGSTNDPRLGLITVRQMLNHTAGWDSSRAIDPYGRSPFDPTVWYQKPAQDLGLTDPITTSNVVEWIIGQRLQYDPDTDFSYSNVGYFVLGRVIEKITGQPYEDYVRGVLKTIGE